MNVTIALMSEEHDAAQALANRRGVTLEELTRQAVLREVARAEAADTLGHVLANTDATDDDEILRAALEQARDRLR